MPEGGKVAPAVWAATIATLLGAGSTAWVTLHPPAPSEERRAEIAELEYLRGQIEEERVHGREEPAAKAVVGTKAGIVAYSIFDTACAKILGPGTAVYVPSPEHRRSRPASAPESPRQSWIESLLGGAVVEAQQYGCRAAVGGYCPYNDPTLHERWEAQIVYEDTFNGYYRVDLLWPSHGGCVQRAWIHPSGDFRRAEWLCCGEY